jgi:putative spermidine/putrescine transport system permease protein
MQNIRTNTGFGSWKRFLVAGLLAIVMAGPAIVVYRLAFSSSHFLDARTGPISFQWFATAITPYWLNATITSALLALAVTSAAVFIAVPAVFYHFRWAGAFSSSVIDLAATAILLIPPISLAVGYFRSFGEGSILPLLVGHLLLAFPFPYFSLRVGLALIPSDVSDAASLLGASDFDIMLRVLLPSLRSYLLLGALLAFLTSWDETVLSVFLTSPELMTLPKAVWETMQRESNLTAAAINAIVAPLFAVSVVQLFIRSSKKAPHNRTQLD